MSNEEFTVQQDIFVMAEEPAEDCTPEELREYLRQRPDEAALADCYACAFNEFGWLAFDLDEPDCPEETRRRCLEWERLEEELCQRIFAILKTEDEVGFEKLLAEAPGSMWVVAPFMPETATATATAGGSTKRFLDRGRKKKLYWHVRQVPPGHCRKVPGGPGSSRPTNHRRKRAETGR